MDIMRQTVTRLAAMSCLLAVVLTTAGAADERADAVQAMNAAWDAAFNAGKAGEVAAMYAEEAQVITGDGAVETGPDNIEALFQSFIESGFSQHQITMASVGGNDGLIYETGTWSGVGGDGETYGGKLVNIYERQEDGSWKTVLHMWN